MLYILHKRHCDITAFQSYYQFQFNILLRKYRFIVIIYFYLFMYFCGYLKCYKHILNHKNFTRNNLCITQYKANCCDSCVIL